MKSNSKHLIIKQIDKKIAEVKVIETMQFSSEGWVNTIRKLLNISLDQLGKKMNITPQAIKGIEKREQAGTVSIKSLNDVANAIDMKLVYIFLPKDGSIENLIARKAMDMAKQIVARSSTTMALEDQQNSNERIKEAIDELAQELIREIPGTLWD